MIAIICLYLLICVIQKIYMKLKNCIQRSTFFASIFKLYYLILYGYEIEIFHEI